ncbi:RAxF-45 family protein [Jeotgalibacillus terrae]|uniref:RAxF-45 family protein n=1 Tax=Jeotgalibacillus terrae TaxID=587735 RepID=A0ABW5ZJ98_9BACL
MACEKRISCLYFSRALIFDFAKYGRSLSIFSKNQKYTS